MAVCSTARATDPSTPCSPRRPTKLRHQPRPARLNGPLPPAELGACFTLGRAKLVQLKPRSLALPTGEWQARFIKSMYSALPHMATKGCFCSYCSWPTSWTTVYRQPTEAAVHVRSESWQLVADSSGMWTVLAASQPAARIDGGRNNQEAKNRTETVCDPCWVHPSRPLNQPPPHGRCMHDLASKLAPRILASAGNTCCAVAWQRIRTCCAQVLAPACGLFYCVGRPQWGTRTSLSPGRRGRM